MVPINQPFNITIKIDRREYGLRVECVSRGPVYEQYKITYDYKDLIFQCNWPVFRNRGLKNRMPTWTMVSGKLTYRSSFKVIVSAIENYIIEQHEKK